MSLDETADDVLLLAEAVGEPELVLPVWEPTGDPAVDAALDELARLDDLGVTDQVGVYAAVHQALHTRLSDLDA